MHNRLIKSYIFARLKQKAILILLLTICVGLTSVASVAGNPPTYPITSYVKLCDVINTLSRDEYDRFGQIFKDSDGWLVSEKLDLQIDYEPLSEQEVSNLSRFASLLHQRNIDLIVLPTPPRGLILKEEIGNLSADFDVSSLNTQFELLIADIQPLGKVINAINLPDAPPKNLFYKSSLDWTPSGAKWFSERIVERVTRKNSQYPVTLSTKAAGLVSAGGAIRSYVESVCNTALEPEYSIGFAATNYSHGDYSDLKIAILGDRLAHEERFQFAQFLSEATASKILNYASPEDSQQWGWLRLIDDIVNQIADVNTIIWQFQSHDGFASSHLFSQLIPALSGGCSSVAQTSESLFTINLNAPSTELLIDKRVARFPPSTLTAELTFTNTQVKSVDVDLWFDNGSSKSVTLPQAFTKNNKILFYIDFSTLVTPKNSHLLALVVKNIELTVGNNFNSVNAGLRLCSK
jgi:alginate biosynthesis protein AlgX